MEKSCFFTNKVNIVLLSVSCMILWGSAFPGVKIGYELFEIKPDQTGSKLVFAGCRFLIAGILTLILAYFFINIKEEKKRLKGKDVLILGLVQTFFQYFFFYLGLSNVSGSKGAILNGTGTFLTVILAHFFLKNDKMNRQKLIGCLIGFMGIVLVNYSPTDFFQLSFTGEGYILFAAISFAVGSILSKGFTARQNPILLTGYQMTFGGALLIGSGFIMGGTIGTITVESSLLFAYLSVLSAVAFTIWTILIKYNHVGKISIYNALAPIFGALLSGLFLGDDVFHIKSLLALFCVSMGIYIVNQKKRVL